MDFLGAKIRKYDTSDMPMFRPGQPCERSEARRHGDGDGFLPGDRDFRSGRSSHDGSGRHARFGPRRQATVNLSEVAAASRRRLWGATRLLGTL